MNRFLASSLACLITAAPLAEISPDLVLDRPCTSPGPDTRIRRCRKPSARTNRAPSEARFRILRALLQSFPSFRDGPIRNTRCI
jgi:hypothetical protein